MEYYDWHGKRLFRRDPAKGTEERWDDKAGGWVDVDDFVTREAINDPDPGFNQVDEATAKKTYAAAFAAGAKTVEAVQNDGAQGDSRFNALSVEDMSRVQGYIMGGKTAQDYLSDNNIDPESDVADQAILYADLMQEAYDGLTPGQTLDAPSEFS